MAKAEIVLGESGGGSSVIEEMTPFTWVHNQGVTIPKTADTKSIVMYTEENGTPMQITWIGGSQIANAMENGQVYSMNCTVNADSIVVPTRMAQSFDYYITGYLIK